MWGWVFVLCACFVTFSIIVELYDLTRPLDDD